MPTDTPETSQIRDWWAFTALYTRLLEPFAWTCSWLTSALLTRTLRRSIKATRSIIDAILGGSIDEAESHSLPIFNLTVPTELTDVDSKLLDPRNSYQQVDEWYAKARNLASLFVDNFAQYTDDERGRGLVNAGPTL